MFYIMKDRGDAVGTQKEHLSTLFPFNHIYSKFILSRNQELCAKPTAIAQIQIHIPPYYICMKQEHVSELRSNEVQAAILG